MHKPRMRSYRCLDALPVRSLWSTSHQSQRDLVDIVHMKRGLASQVAGLDHILSTYHQSQQSQQDTVRIRSDHHLVSVQHHMGCMCHRARRSLLDMLHRRFGPRLGLSHHYT